MSCTQHYVLTVKLGRRFNEDLFGDLAQDLMTFHGGQEYHVDDVSWDLKAIHNDPHLQNITQSQLGCISETGLLESACGAACFEPSETGILATQAAVLAAQLCQAGVFVPHDQQLREILMKYPTTEQPLQVNMYL